MDAATKENSLDLNMFNRALVGIILDQLSVLLSLSVKGKRI